MRFWLSDITLLQKVSCPQNIGQKVGKRHIYIARINLNDTDDVIILKSREFENTLFLLLQRNGCYQTWRTERVMIW